MSPGHSAVAQAGCTAHWSEYAGLAYLEPTLVYDLILREMVQEVHSRVTGHDQRVFLRTTLAASAGPSDEPPVEEPKRRGRPRKTVSVEPIDDEIPEETRTVKKRGRRTKAEIEQANQAADQAFATIGQELSSVEAAEEPEVTVPVDGPGSWADAAANTAGEEDRRRFPYHRCAACCSRSYSNCKQCS